MMVLKSDILSILDGIRGSVVASKLAAFSTLAASLAALFAAFVLLRLAHDYVSGQGLTFWELVRPFVLVLLVARFNTFVADPIHRVVNIFTNGIERQVEKTSVKYYENLRTFLARSVEIGSNEIGQKISPNNTSPKESEVSSGGWQKVKDFVGNIGDSVLSAIGSFFKGIKDFFAQIIVSISNMVGFGLDTDKVFETPFLALLSLILTGVLKIALFMQQCQCYVILTILTLLGPFAFALSIFNSYRQTISSWIARYISIALWIPIGQIVLFVSYFLLENVSGLEVGVGLKQPLLTVCAIIVSIMMLKRVPMMSGYVVESAGSGGVENGTSLADAGAAVKAAGARILGHK